MLYIYVHVQTIVNHVAYPDSRAVPRSSRSIHPWTSDAMSVTNGHDGWVSEFFNNFSRSSWTSEVSGLCAQFFFKQEKKGSVFGLPSAF